MIEHILLNAVTANTDGSVTQLPHNSGKLDIFVKATGVTSGATVQVQVKSPTGDWHDLLSSDQAGITADGNFGPFHCPIGYPAVRGRVTALTDGTYTVSIIARD